MAVLYQITVNGYCVYIGETLNFDSRRSQHWKEIFHPKSNKYYILNACMAGGYKIEIKPMSLHVPEEKRFQVEKEWIQKVRPPLNSKHNNNIGSKITLQEFFNNYI